MRVRLIIPALFQFADAVGLPRGLLALRRAERIVTDGDWLEARLCRLFGLQQQPVARLTQALDLPGMDHSCTRCLRADPVHLAVAQNSMSVLAGAPLQLEIHEAASLAATLNPLLQQDGMQLHTATSQRWYLQVPASPDAHFMPLPLALGRPLPAQTISGPHAAQWKRRVAEIQMSLHQHPVNEAREQRGLPAINHLWLWGEGGPATPHAPAARLWGDHVLLQALASQSGVTLQPLPSSFARWQDKAHGEEHILVLDSLQDSAHRMDVAGWSATLASLDEHWLAPLLHGGLQQVIIEVPAAEQSLSYSLGRWSRYSFWKNSHVGH